MESLSTVSFMNSRKIELDLREKAEQTNLTKHRLRIVLKFEINRQSDAARFLYIYIWLSLLITGCCTQDFPSAVRVAVGDPVILEGAGNNEYVPEWDWQFAPSKGSSHPLTICKSEKTLAANYSIYGECSCRSIRIQSAADYHDGTYTFTRFHPENVTQVKHQLIIVKNVARATTLKNHTITEDTMNNKSLPATNSDENQDPRTSHGLLAGITVAGATIGLVVIVLLCVVKNGYRPTCRPTDRTKTYNSANKDPPSREVSVKFSKETVEFLHTTP